MTVPCASTARAARGRDALDQARGRRSGVGVTVDAVEVDGRRVEGGVRVTIAGALAGGVRQEWRAGRTVAMTVLLREPLDYRDPGVPSDRARLARQGIVLLGSVKSAALTAIVGARRVAERRGRRAARLGPARRRPPPSADGARGPPASSRRS